MSRPRAHRAGEPADAAVDPLLAGIVVHWHNEELLAGLVAAWPLHDPRFELVIVDNGSDRLPAAVAAGDRLRLVDPGANLGFAGGVNAGLAASRAPLAVLLNPDAHPETGALDALVTGFAAHPEAAGLAPKLVGEDASGQHAWQLRALPGLGRLLLQALQVPLPEGSGVEPAAGTPVEQPAAAALALRRSALDDVGGLDAAFYPAWFEDVDLARRLADSGHRLLYWPAARFRHRLGASLPRLGFGPFLWIHFRGLERYVGKHHGAVWALVARLAIALGTALRALAVPLRRPRRAAGRGEALRGLIATSLGAATGWRRPAAWADLFAPPGSGRAASGNAP